MATKQQKISVETCREELKLMARRTALLHYYFSKTIIEALGPEAGEQLIKQAVLAYGAHCGRYVRQGVEALGLPLTEENFHKVRDLPDYVWETATIPVPDGGQRPIARYCPLAETFMQLGEDGMRLGRLYCYVDQGKQSGYNPDYEYVHVHNLLDGDGFCEFWVRPRQE